MTTATATVHSRKARTYHPTNFQHRPSTTAATSSSMNAVTFAKQHVGGTSNDNDSDNDNNTTATTVATAASASTMATAMAIATAATIRSV